MYIKKILNIISMVVVFAATTGCDDDSAPQGGEGVYKRSYVSTLKGFWEEKNDILRKNNVSETEFIVLSTDSAWAFEGTDMFKIKGVRKDVSPPGENTLLQKILPLEDLPTYMNNVYGGTIGGFVCEAADVKRITTPVDAYWGLRLDYSGTKFRPDGAGYAVIRFRSKAASTLSIPFSPELGGTQPHSWPNGGGGFTTSTLGYGGFPEWIFNGYYAPEEGGEIYEVSADGKETLRSVYKVIDGQGAWTTYGSSSQPKRSRASVDGLHDGQLIRSYAIYCEHKFNVRGLNAGLYLLTTTDPRLVPDLQVIEKGIYGVYVDESEVNVFKESIGHNADLKKE